MASAADFDVPDDSRPVKRARIEAPLAVTKDFQSEVDDDDNWDDIYGLDTSEKVEESNLAAMDPISRSDAVVAAGSAASETEDDHNNSLATSAPATAVTKSPDGDGTRDFVDDQGSSTVDSKDGVAPDAIDAGDRLVADEVQLSSTDKPSAQILDEITHMETGELSLNTAEDVEKRSNGAAPAPGQNAQNGPSTDNAGVLNGEMIPMINSAVGQQQQEDGSNASKTNAIKPKDDPEFLAAAAAQKKDAEAEWQFDSSDAESSSDSESSSSDSSSDDSDSDSEGGYEMLDPATAAKILMSGDGDEDGDRGDKGDVDRQPRTANEVKETAVPKPNVVITPDTCITFVGTVDSSVENMVLIKAATPGEFQVLEAGSVLCNESREVIGAVTETLGRVQQPYYSVAFTNDKEIAEAGLVAGVKVFYVNDHSTFVFTQPLRNTKGTDASNIHDEEVGEHEIEFSDDEKEAEYKRMKKLAKRGGRGGFSRSTFDAERSGNDMHSVGTDAYYDGHQSYATSSDVPQQEYGGSISYDDDVQDEFYVPLKRPDNLSQMMATGGPPRSQPNFDRGRGRGRGDFRGRGRGDRGKGRGGFNQNSPRGYGRNGHYADRGHAKAHRGNSHSFPDHHNNDVPEEPKYHDLPSKPGSQQHQDTVPDQRQDTQARQTYQFNGYTFQYGNPPPPLYAVPVPAPMAGFQQQPTAPYITPGAYVNPNFFSAAQQQQQQQQTSQHQQQGPQSQWGQQQSYPQWQPQQQQQQQQSHPTLPMQQNNLADIMRQFEGGQ